MKNRIAVVLLSILCLLDGTLIYSIARAPNLYLNQLVHRIFSDELISRLQSIFQNVHLPGWLIYSLPDALWMLALTLLILLVWNFRLNRISILWMCIAIISGVLIECLQAFHLIRGTFDPVDLAFIFVGAFIPISISILNVKSCKTS